MNPAVTVDETSLKEVSRQFLAELEVAMAVHRWQEPQQLAQAELLVQHHLFHLLAHHQHHQSRIQKTRPKNLAPAMRDQGNHAFVCGHLSSLLLCHALVQSVFPVSTVVSGIEMRKQLHLHLDGVTA